MELQLALGVFDKSSRDPARPSVKLAVVLAASFLAVVLYHLTLRFADISDDANPGDALALNMQRNREHESVPKGRQLLGTSGEGFGCSCGADTDCWAGVYVDPATGMVLHLDPGGLAYRDPGTALSSDKNGAECLRWRPRQDVLELIECRNGEHFRWPGARGDLRRDRPRPGRLTGFGVPGDQGGQRKVDLKDEPVPWDSTAVNIARPPGRTHLVRDPSGFLFPGCAYILSLHPRSRCDVKSMEQVRVFLDRRGSLRHETSGERIASVSFATEPCLLSDNGGDTWTVGDAIVIRLDPTNLEGGTGNVGQDGEDIPEFELSSSNGGRTWTSGEECLELTLIAPVAASMLALGEAISPDVAYLNDWPVDDVVVVENEPIMADQGQLRPIFSIFEVQASPSVDAGSALPERLAALIVISRDLARPTERGELSCVINGKRRRAVWLSWSMVLCSVAGVETLRMTAHLSYEGRRVSAQSIFETAPPPRHTRIAWPPSEIFGALDPVEADEDTSPGVPRSEHDRLDLAETEDGGPDARIAICTMFKNEAPYLEEWLEYHRLLGVFKIYMYDNGSTDDSRKVIEKYERTGLVRVRDWHDDGAQTEALNDCLCRFRHTARWIAFIDVDEFIDPAPSLPIVGPARLVEGILSSPAAGLGDVDHASMVTRRRSLMEMLDASAPHSHTHCAPWVNYCASGQEVAPSGGVLGNYLELEDMGEARIHMQKPIFKAMDALTLRRIGPHFLLYATEDVGKQYKRNLRCPFEWLRPESCQIRHYRSKSLEEFVGRRVGADSAYKNRRYTREHLTSEWRQTNAHCGKREA